MVNPENEKYVYLRPEIQSGAVILVDQHGRKVKGVRVVDVHNDFQDNVSFNAEVLAQTPQGKPYVGRGW